VNDSFLAQGLITRCNVLEQLEYVALASPFAYNF
jgi:hypothetical protein